MARARVAWSVLLIVAGCTSGAGPTATTIVRSLPSASSSPSATPSSTVIPWSPETPDPFVTPAPAKLPDAAPCRVDQVSAGLAGWQGATGSMVGGFLLWNTSRQPCRLAGRPSVAILDAAGHRLSVTDLPAPSPTAQPLVLPADQPTPVLHAEATEGLALVTLQWFNWCGVPPIGPLSLAIELPEGGVLRTPVVMGGIPRCDAPSGGSSISVGAFDATPGPSPTDPPAVPAEALKVSLEVPDHATAGQALHYVVILTNPTSNPIALSPCPAYQERINTQGGGVVADYVLDCAPAPTIAPGASVRFAMELNIPAPLPASDDAALVWSLDPYYSEGFPPRSPMQKLRIRIVSP